MSAQVFILTPETTAGAGGLADYALRVVEEWGEAVQAQLIASVSELPPNSRVLLHYSAYGFDRFGYPRALLRDLLKWKLKGSGRLVLMLHEIWTFWPLLNKNRFLQSLHRGDLRKLILAADAVFTSTPSQAEHLLELVPTKAIQVLPVGSTIRPSAAGAVREEGVAILFGLQGTRLKALRRMEQELKSLAAAKVIRKVITVGHGNFADAEERALLADLHLSENFEMRGALPEADVSAALARAGFALSAQDELSVYKSGTFMAYAAYGLNILSPFADPFAPEPICWLTRSDDLARGIAPNEWRERAQQLQRWQERTSSWPHIARQFAEALGI